LSRPDGLDVVDAEVRDDGLARVGELEVQVEAVRLADAFDGADVDVAFLLEGHRLALLLRELDFAVQRREGELGAEPLPGLRLDASLTLTDARDTTGRRATANDVLPFLPRLVFSPGVTYGRSLNVAGIERVALSARYIHQASRYADRAGLAFAPGSIVR
jgi:hypothetical protein